MKKSSTFAVVTLAACLAFIAPSAFSQGVPHDLDSLGWLAGCWEGTYANGRTVTEQWMKPLGDLMMGMSRTVKNGKTVEYESVRLTRSEDGSIHYTSKPSRQEEASFRLVKLDGNSAVFVNPEHDFPQRIIYRLVTRDSLAARIEGTIEGKEKGSDFPYRRVKCEQ